MAWDITQTTVDFVGNRAVVQFNKSGGIAEDFTSISVSFPIVDNNHLPPQDADREALIAQAKQILTDAAK